MKRLSAQTLGSEFSDIEPYVDVFCSKYPEYSKLDMIQTVLKGDAVLWADDEFFIYGSPVIYPNLRVFMIEAAGGKNADVNTESLLKIEDEVKAWGFDVIQSCIRKGFLPLMKEIGYSERSVLVQKRIDE